MLYWTGGSGGSSETLHGLSHVTKAEILRGIVTEKLTTAAQEIFAVVERTVAGYEEEASGFRREIERQRRQLEVLLQPRVKLERRDFEVCEAAVVQNENEEQQTQNSGLENTGNLGLVWNEDGDDGDGGDGGDEEHQPSVPLETSSRQRQEDLKDPDYQIKPRSVSPRVQSKRRGPGRPRISDTLNHLDLRICILEDSQSDVLSNRVFKKCPVEDLRCPRGMQEADFLDLLRSTFPQLAAQKPFDFFTTNRTKRLQPLKVKTLTPEEIYRSIRSTGHSALYIRQKTGDDPQSSSEDLHPPKRQNDSPSSCATTPTDQPQMFTSSHVQHVEGASSSTSQQQDMDTEEADDEDAAESQVDSSDDDVKDGEEASDGDNDWKPDPELQSSKTKRKRGAKMSAVEGKLTGTSKTACKVCGSWYRIQGGLIRHAWSHLEEPQCVCGVCGERFESVEELKGHLKNYQRTHNCSDCEKSFLTITGLNSHITLHTGNRPFKCDVCNKAFAHTSSLSIHRWIHVADKPHKCDVCPKAFGLKAQLRAHRKLHAGRERYHCNICGKSMFHLRSLTHHMVTHSGERRYGCEVCGKHFKLPSTLKAHEKTHTDRDRPYLCHICSKTFHSNIQLTIHMKTHSNDRPFLCTVCGKGFISNTYLNTHMRVHTGEAPYGCSECGRFYKHKSHLNDHMRRHKGIKLFVCTVCGKACSRQEHLRVHMRTHNGEKPYQCTVCDKAFTQSHCLKTHMKSHEGEQN